MYRSCSPIRAYMMWKRAFATYRSFGHNVPPSAWWSRYRRPIVLTCLAGGAVYAANLEPAPVTGRLRFMIVPKWYETRVGDVGYRQTIAQFGPHILPDYHPSVQRVKKVMKNIIKVSGITGVNWQIHVVKGNFPPNAFVLPGGKVFVFESILPICRDEDGLATVLSHETAHQVCRHTAEQLSKAPIFFVLAIVLSAVTGYGALDRMVLNLALRLPASRKMEQEADHVGVMMMAEACYNPSAAVGLWQRMMQMERRMGSLPEFLSTHPASSHRIENIKGYLSEAERVRSEHCLGSAFTDFWR